MDSTRPTTLGRPTGKSYPLPCGCGLEAINIGIKKQCAKVLILCRMEMGWKELEKRSPIKWGDVVILCRMEMGWKIPGKMIGVEFK